VLSGPREATTRKPRASSSDYQVQIPLALLIELTQRLQLHRSGDDRAFSPPIEVSKAPPGWVGGLRRVCAVCDQHLT
jgi:hypothetical protein